jgi:hypothetical protein
MTYRHVADGQPLRYRSMATGEGVMGRNAVENPVYCELSKQDK